MAHVQKNFRAGDFKLGSKKDVPAEANEPEQSEQPEQTEQSEQTEETESTAEETEEDDSEAPDGTISEIMAWVANDKDRAGKALDKENQNPEPRSSLVDKLERIIEG